MSSKIYESIKYALLITVFIFVFPFLLNMSLAIVGAIFISFTLAGYYLDKYFRMKEFRTKVAVWIFLVASLVAAFYISWEVFIAAKGIGVEGNMRVMIGFAPVYLLGLIMPFFLNTLYAKTDFMKGWGKQDRESMQKAQVTVEPALRKGRLMSLLAMHEMTTNVSPEALIGGQEELNNLVDQVTDDNAHVKAEPKTSYGLLTLILVLCMYTGIYILLKLYLCNMIPAYLFCNL